MHPMDDHGSVGTHGKDAFFRLLVKNILDYAIFVMGPEGRVQTWNEGAERLLGYAESEILGEPVEKFYTPEDLRNEVPAKERQQALATGRGEDDRWHVRKNGTRFWSSGVLTPLLDEKGIIWGFAKIMRDRTDLKRTEISLQDALEYAQNIVQTVREPLVVLDTMNCETRWLRFAAGSTFWRSAVRTLKWSGQCSNKWCIWCDWWMTSWT